MNPQQIREWDLPSRPSKPTDTRCKSFFQQFGVRTESVELDAVHPDMLRMLVRDAIEQHLPDGLLESIEREEALAREVLNEISHNWSTGA